MSEALKTTHWCIYSEKAIKIIEFRNKKCSYTCKCLIIFTTPVCYFQVKYHIFDVTLFDTCSLFFLVIHYHYQFAFHKNDNSPFTLMGKN